MSALDGQLMPWDGLTFAFIGDVIQGQATSVILPENTFWTVHNIRARSIDYIMTHLEDFGAYGLPYPTANEPEANPVTTKTIMYLPAKYVPLILNSTGYTLRQLWEILYPAIVDANDLGPCDTLLKWMRVASMSVTQNQIQGPTALAQDLQVP
jgi:hypothetical protein